MSKLSSLLKATMSDGIQLFNYRAKNERYKWTMPILLALLISVMMLFSAAAMVTELSVDNAESAILPIYAMVTTIIIVTEGVYKSGDLLFRPRDNDMLLAMPIKKPTIVLARMVKFYVFEMLYCLIFLLPAIIAYAMNVTVGASYYLVAITMLLLLPVIPIAISCIAGLVISAISSRFKHKAFLEVVLSFVALFLVTIFVIMANTATDFDGSSMVAFSDKLTEIYYPASALVGLVEHFDVWQYLIFVVVNLAILAVTVLIISRFYFRIVNRMSITKLAQKVGTKYHFARHGQVFAMVKKEFIRYFSTPVLLTNTALGLVLFIVAVGALCVKFDDIANSLMTSVENFPLTLEEIFSYLPSITFAMVAFASLLTLITATTISLEGKAFNLLKSMPISGKKVIMSKVLAAVLLIVPVNILGSIIMCLRFQFGVLDGLLILIAAIIIPLVTELVGILVNLKYARFDAESDAIVVRQSASVLVATFLGLGMVLVTISLTFATVFLAGQVEGIAMMDAIFIIVAIYLYSVIAARGEEKYRKLTA